MIKRNSLGLLPFLSGRIEQEPMEGSSPNRPQNSSQVATSAPKPKTQVRRTIKMRYLGLYNLKHSDVLNNDYFGISFSLFDKSDLLVVKRVKIYFCPGPKLRTELISRS